MTIDLEKEKIRAELLGSLLEFIKTFFKIVTGRDFLIPNPPGREPHPITICRELTKAFRLELEEHRTVINVPPGHFKSTITCYWVAWCMAHYPDSNFLYISYAKSLATKGTQLIRSIMQSSHYKYLFDVHLKSDSTAKDLFETTAGGVVCAFGSQGAITGRDAGLPDQDRFSGAIIIDDPHKPDEAMSDTTRNAVLDNYINTIMQRTRGIKVPQIFIGQRLHEEDLAAFLLEGKDGHKWDNVILKSLDECNNPLYPEEYPLERLLNVKQHAIYVFSAQHQQEPTPAGGALYRREFFPLLSETPRMLKTFITADTAETDKNYNDATVFSFWGIYEIELLGRPTGKLGLHWIDCWELRVEPKDLKESFISFFNDTLNFPVHPLIAAIEKKSTGTTLISTLQDLRGIDVVAINRDVSSGSKAQRFLNLQPYLAAKLVSFTEGAKHVEMCLRHLEKITANDSHRFDDICDTLADAVKLALIDKTIYKSSDKSNAASNVMSSIGNKMKQQQRAKAARYGTSF